MKRTQPAGMRWDAILKADMTAFSMHLFRTSHSTEYKYSGHLPKNQGGKRIQPLPGTVAASGNLGIYITSDFCKRF